jgi:hypothetical protein
MVAAAAPELEPAESLVGDAFTPAQKARFQDDGFLIVDRLVDPSLAEAIKHRFPHLFRCATDFLFIFSIYIL